MNDKARSVSGGRTCRTDQQLYLKTKELRQLSKKSNLRFHLSSTNISIRSVQSRGGVSKKESESSLERIHTFNLKAGGDVKNAAGLSEESGSTNRKVKNLKSLISLKVAAAEQK